MGILRTAVWGADDGAAVASTNYIVSPHPGLRV
jgi:hypothetical protein